MKKELPNGIVVSNETDDFWNTDKVVKIKNPYIYGDLAVDENSPSQEFVYDANFTEGSCDESKPIYTTDNEMLVYCPETDKFTIDPHTGKIGRRAFSNSKIKEIKMGESVTQIECNAFENCIDLTDIYINNPNPDLIVVSPLAFDEATLQNAKLHVPFCSIAEYQQHDFFSKFKKIVNI